MLGNKSIKECADYLNKYDKEDTFIKNVAAMMDVLHALSTVIDSFQSVKDYLKKNKKKN